MLNDTKFKILSRPIRIDMAVKNTTKCNIQGVSVYTNVSANYMFRPLLVRQSSGWMQWSEELYNNAILLKSGGTRSRLQKMGHMYRQVVLKYMCCCH
jgi:hypothetical protein